MVNRLAILNCVSDATLLPDTLLQIVLKAWVGCKMKENLLHAKLPCRYVSYLCRNSENIRRWLLNFSIQYFSIISLIILFYQVQNAAVLEQQRTTDKQQHRSTTYWRSNRDSRIAHASLSLIDQVQLITICRASPPVHIQWYMYQKERNTHTVLLRTA